MKKSFIFLFFVATTLFTPATTLARIIIPASPGVDSDQKKPSPVLVPTPTVRTAPSLATGATRRSTYISAPIPIAGAISPASYQSSPAQWTTPNDDNAPPASQASAPLVYQRTWAATGQIDPKPVQTAQIGVNLHFQPQVYTREKIYTYSRVYDTPVYQRTYEPDSSRTEPNTSSPTLGTPYVYMRSEPYTYERVYQPDTYRRTYE